MKAMRVTSSAYKMEGFDRPRVMSSMKMMNRRGRGWSLVERHALMDFMLEDLPFRTTFREQSFK
jgi:hypothetical protein